MIEIQEFQERHRPDVLRLYRDIFGSWSAERFAARWQWQFAANPFAAERPPFIQVAVENDRVIGHLASFPVPLRLNGRRKIGLCASDFLVDRGHPTAAASMFRSLMRQPPVLATGFGTPAASMLRLSGATQLPASAVSCSYQIRSTGALRRALKRRLPSGLAFLAAPVLARPLSQLWRRPPRPKTTRILRGGVKLRAIPRFTQEHEDLWKDVFAGRESGVDKDARYMNWRYADGPARTASFLELRGDDGRLRGLIIGGVRAELHEQSPCGSTGVVCELWTRPGDKEAARDLAFGILQRLDAEEVDAVHVPGISSEVQKALTDAGFVGGEAKEYHVAVKAVPEDLGPQTATDPEKFWVSAGDGDMLLATML